MYPAEHCNFGIHTCSIGRVTTYTTYYSFIRRFFFFLTRFLKVLCRHTAQIGDWAPHNYCCSPVPPTNGRGSYALHPRSTPPVDTPPRSFLPMLQLHFLASDDRVCCSIGASLARKWSCSNGKNDRGGISTGGVLLGCNV